MAVEDRRIVVFAEWDAEAGVYVAQSEDVPGLITEAVTVSDLEQKLKIIIPELMELNDPVAPGPGQFEEIPMVINVQVTSKVRVHA
jgi:predicted RNase H-like HicB family nuclease